MLEGLVVTGLLALFAGWAHKSSDSNHNTQYCVADSVRSNPKQERAVTPKSCFKGSMMVDPSKQLPLSERKAK
jgi:hypothetical protein